MKKAVILLNELRENALPDELDVLDQACAVEDALEELEYESERVFMSLDLASCARAIREISPDVVINLAESGGGRADMIYLGPALLKSLAVPFTGCPPEAVFLTSHKLLAKKILKSAGIPTPEWSGEDSFAPGTGQKTFIVKPLWEDASVGITDKNVFSGDGAEILEEFRQKFGRDFFIEEYIPGREFNISILETGEGPLILPPAEMLFSGFPDSKPHIVGYAAKWDEESFEYENTRRSFDFPETDATLLETLRRLSLDCWDQFGLSGYARIDFRVNENGQPFVLEINANPCISPDSGFYAACEKAGLTFTNCIDHLIRKALNQANGNHLSK